MSVSEFTLKLSPGTILNVADCLVMDPNSQLVVVVTDESLLEGDTTIATFDPECSSEQLTDRVYIEEESPRDECRDGTLVVVQKQDTQGRARLELLSVPVDKSKCDNDSELNILAISIAVPIAVATVVVIILVFAIPSLRNKILRG